MSGPICPHCEQEMDEELAEEGICSACGKRFNECELGKVEAENVESEDEDIEAEPNIDEPPRLI